MLQSCKITDYAWAVPTLCNLRWMARAYPQGSLLRSLHMCHHEQALATATSTKKILKQNPEHIAFDDNHDMCEASCKPPQQLPQLLPGWMSGECCAVLMRAFARGAAVDLH